jgi:hypothetical protein
MSRADRKALIEEIQALRDSKVLTYITGDRAPAPAQIGDDAVRPMYDHLRQLRHVDRLDLFIYSRGGAIDVPWRIVTALRTTADEVNVLVPFRANSAATLIALGADEIVLGRQGELGPIDPIMNIQRLWSAQPGVGQPTFVQETINVEDIMAYLRFVRERAGLSDQTALSTSLSELTQRLDAIGLGNAHRTHSHIRDVARRMLLSRKEPASEQVMAAIIETLAERVYAHGHAIGLKDAESIGLPVTAASDDLDKAMWGLLNAYESDLKLLEPIDPAVAVAAQDIHKEEATIALVESEWAEHAFRGEIEIRAKRQMPPNLNVQLSVNIQLPQNINAQQLPATVQQALQQAQQALLQQAQQAVQQALKDQAPLQGFDAGFRGGRWEKVS